MKNESYNILYKEADKTDASALLEHIKRVGAETDNLSFSSDTFAISLEREEKFIDRFHNSKNDIMLVALDGDRIVGNSVIERDKILRFSHRAELSITVLKDYWGKGIGTELMHRALDFAKSAGIELVYLETRSDNVRAIALYEKFGFVKIGEFNKYFKIGEKYYSADIMTKEL
jgi:RimJ/RimL family protein N-acetyltransferase